MPLIKSPSKKAFKKNIEAEMDAGKPLKQSLAIAYDVKRKTMPRKKMFTGGSVEANEQHPEMLKADTSPSDKEMPASIDMDPSEHDSNYMGSESVADKILRKHNALKKEMYEDADNMYAEGGMITENSEEDNGHSDLMLNGVAQPRIFGERNHDMMDENMNDPIEEASYPPIPGDRNPHDENDDSIIARIKRKMKKS